MTQDGHDLVKAGLYLAAVPLIGCTLYFGVVAVSPQLRDVMASAIEALPQDSGHEAVSLDRADEPDRAEAANDAPAPAPSPAIEAPAQAESAEVPRPAYGAWARAKARAGLAARPAKRKSARPTRRTLPANVYGSVPNSAFPKSAVRPPPAARVWSYDPGRVY
jgi:hypothetical protein